MTDQKVKDFTMPTGEHVRGVELDFDIQKEIWNEYDLSDGTTLRLKTTLVRAIRVYDNDNNPVFNNLGQPEVVVNTTLMVFTKDNEEE